MSTGYVAEFHAAALSDATSTAVEEAIAHHTARTNSLGDFTGDPNPGFAELDSPPDLTQKKWCRNLVKQVVCGDIFGDFCGILAGRSVAQIPNVTILL